MVDDLPRDPAREGTGARALLTGRLRGRPVPLLLAALIAVAGAGVAVGQSGGAPEVLALGPAGPPDPDGLPEGWNVLRFRNVRVPTHYALVPADGRHVLRAESRGGASALYRPVDVDPGVYRVIAWRWKVDRVLEGSDPRRKEGDDYPARVYVAFAYDPRSASAWQRTLYGVYKSFYGEYPPAGVLNYIWDTRLPQGTVLDNAYTSRARMIVVQSGPDRVGQWVQEERDLYEDYRRAFGGEPPRLAGVAVMTDTDDTGEHAVAYYDAIELRPVQ